MLREDCKNGGNIITYMSQKRHKDEVLSERLNSL